MNIPWRVSKELEDYVIDRLRDKDWMSDESFEQLLKSPINSIPYVFKGYGCGGIVDVTFNLLLEAGNPRAIKAYIQQGDHYNLALFCSRELRKQAQRAEILSKFGDLPKAGEFWPECLDYFWVFSSDEVVDRHNEDDEWELVPRAKAVSDYVHSQFRIHDDPRDAVCSAYTKDGKELYNSDRVGLLEMYEAIYKELVK